MPQRREGHASPERARSGLPLQRARASLSSHLFPAAARIHNRRDPLTAPTYPDNTSQRERDLDLAVSGLRRRRPDLSAAEPLWAWQKAALIFIIPIFATVAVLAPHRAAFILATTLALPFCCIVLLRTSALWKSLAATAHPADGSPRAPSPLSLPRYSVLVPLHDEADIVRDLLAALDGLDYPIDRLEIFLALEETDQATRKAIEAEILPPHITVVIVPEGLPQTKPRALNYVLPRTTGDLVVIYDAEDLPEPDQLRRAVAALTANPDLGCVQARLNVLNADETWLTRQYAIEYTVLFDCMLPTLEALKLPVPLGGTSNHFTRSALEDVGAWDPFNVTEDADLGIRLARNGWSVGVVPSTTWEEAPANFKSWLKQRTRWLKGWMQTYLVHMRNPWRTLRDLGWRQFAGLQVLMGGMVLSALVHPWLYVAIAADAAYGPFDVLGDDVLSRIIKIVTVANLVLGYVSGVVLGIVAMRGRGRQRLAAWALLMPAYWLLISLAAYRALLQLATSPYRWEKTQHRPRAAFAPLRPSGKTH
ncbi:glycosyltransferase [Hyphomicrobium nitrativorans]|uniref:glycosyltransferase n=1 Tax=Hyphomicrobium nitrativorans TaxID=1427356 RepID=UPI00130D95CE|nr:glycosyltransferase [Hyphomicrobium nitrativorans]